MSLTKLTPSSIYFLPLQVRQGTDQRSIELWNEFRQTAERFERQRVASESGMAFLFSEGALVDALRTGKWYEPTSASLLFIIHMIFLFYIPPILR